MKRQSETLLQETLALPEPDRAEIAGALLQSLEPPPEPGVEKWHQEVARRVAQIEAGVVQTIPWEEVRDRLYSRLNTPKSS